MFLLYLFDYDATHFVPVALLHCCIVILLYGGMVAQALCTVI